MQQQQSDRILDLLSSALKVESEIETHAKEVGARLDERFLPSFASLGEEPTGPSSETTLRVMSADLGASREALSEAEQRNIHLVKEEVRLRSESRELNRELYGDFSSLRRSLEELIEGDEGHHSAFVLAGIQGPTAQSPSKLLRQVDLAIAHLSDPELVLPAPRFGGVQLDATELARDLQRKADRLRQLRAELQSVLSQLNASRKEKNRALDHHKSTFLWIARGAESFFQLAGESELAERIRPSTRRPGRRAVEVAEDGGSSDDGSGGESADGESAGGQSTDGESSGSADDGAAVSGGSPADTASAEAAPQTSPPAAQAAGPEVAEPASPTSDG